MEILKNVLGEARFRIGFTRRARELEQELETLRAGVKQRDSYIRRLEGTEHVDPAKIVWILGSPRTGSTWLGRMLSHPGGRHLWREPLLGRVLGLRSDIVNQGYLANERFVLGDPHKDVWLPHYRRVLLEVASVHLPEICPEDYLVAKEPNAGDGASLLLEAFPESRAIFLYRDPRDVVASLMDAAAPGSWYPYGRFEWSESADPKTLAESWIRSISAAKEAYQAHHGPKVMMSYESLRERPGESLAFVQDALELPNDEDERRAAVEATSWEALREDQKGAGKFHRKGVAGGWEEDLDGDQVRIVEAAAGPLMQELGYKPYFWSNEGLI